MTLAQFEIQLIGILVASACALTGIFLILRRMAMMSDAISHAILLGIVLAFFVTKDLASPFLIIAAALSGILMVSLVELLNGTRLVREDASIGLVFPLLFSIGVILISRYAGNIHLDTDAVLLGELAFAPFNRLSLFGYDLGPKSIYTISTILLLNIVFIFVFYKEIKLSTFDAGLAASLGFAPGLLHYALMSLVSITAVGSFDAVGSILVVAFMIAPPATAYLLTDKLTRMIWISVIIGSVSAVSGYWIAHFADASIAGSMATMCGVLFLLTFLFSPYRGIIAIMHRRIQQKWEFAQIMLTVHLHQHQDLPEHSFEKKMNHCHIHMKWNEKFTQRVIKLATEKNLITEKNGYLYLTKQGAATAEEAITT